jgi:hypothetical protein
VTDTDYKTPFKFTGTIDKVTIAVDPPKLIQKLKAASPLRLGLAVTGTPPAEEGRGTSASLGRDCDQGSMGGRASGSTHPV